MVSYEKVMGLIYIAPKARDREKFHSWHECPHVKDYYVRLEPGDNGYSDVIGELDECMHCRYETLDV